MTSTTQNPAHTDSHHAAEQALDLLAQIHPLPDDQSTREFRMALACARGATLMEAGALFNLTGERARQLMNATPWSATQVRRARREAQVAQREQVRERVQAWSQANQGVSASMGARELGLGEADMLEALRGRRRLHPDGPPKPRRDKGEARKQQLASMRACYESTGACTQKSFAQWAREHGCAGPQTVAMTFGSWVEALKQAGIRADAASTYTAVYSLTDLRAALVAALRDNPDLTSSQYGVWARDHEGAPSLATLVARMVKQRGEPWSSLVAQGFAVLRGDEAALEAWGPEVLRERDWHAPVVSREDVVGLVRECVQATGSDVGLSQQAYDAWARDRGVPRHGYVLRHAGGSSWQDLVEEVGGSFTNHNFPLDEDRVRDALRSFFEEHPDGSSSQYQQWSTRRGGRVPATSSLYRRYGTWAKVQELFAH